MKTPSFKCLLSLFTLALSIAAWADRTWTGNSTETTKYWSDTENWDGTDGTWYINSSATVNFNESESTKGISNPIAISGGTEESPIVFAADSEVNGLEMNSGAGNARLDSGYWNITSGYYLFSNDLVLNNNGKLTIDGGQVNTRYWFAMGGTSEFTLANGSFRTAKDNGASNPLNGALNIGTTDNADVKLYVTGGTLTSYGSANGGDMWQALMLGNATGAKATMVVSDEGKYTSPNDVTVGRASNSTGTITVKGKGTFNVWTMNLANGSKSTATIDIQENASMSLVGIMNGATTAGAKSDINVTGGSLVVNGDFYTALSGTGTLTVGGSTTKASVTTPNATWVSMTRNSNGDGTITLKQNGTLTCGFVEANNASASKNNFIFDGGTLCKNHGTGLNNGGYMIASDTNATISVTANGGTLDLKEYAAEIKAPITGVGTLTKKGSGTLTLSGGYFAGIAVAEEAGSVTTPGGNTVNAGESFFLVSKINRTATTDVLDGKALWIEANGKVTLTGVVLDFDTADEQKLFDVSALKIPNGTVETEPDVTAYFTIDDATEAYKIIYKSGAVYAVANRTQNKWIGEGEGAWTEPSNWSEKVVPDEHSLVVFDGDAVVTCSGMGSAKRWLRLKLENNATVEFKNTDDTSYPGWTIDSNSIEGSGTIILTHCGFYASTDVVIPSTISIVIQNSTSTTDNGYNCWLSAADGHSLTVGGAVEVKNFLSTDGTVTFNDAVTVYAGARLNISSGTTTFNAALTCKGSAVLEKGSSAAVAKGQSASFTAPTGDSHIDAAIAALFGVNTTVNVWRGGETGDWGEKTNWRYGVPTSLNNAVFTSKASVSMSGAQAMNALEVQNNSEVSLIRSSGDPSLRFKAMTGTGTLKLTHIGLVKIGDAESANIASTLTLDIQAFNDNADSTDCWFSVDGTGVLNVYAPITGPGFVNFYGGTRLYGDNSQFTGRVFKGNVDARFMTPESGFPNASRIDIHGNLYAWFESGELALGGNLTMTTYQENFTSLKWLEHEILTKNNSESVTIVVGGGNGTVRLQGNNRKCDPWNWAENQVPYNCAHGTIRKIGTGKMRCRMHGSYNLDIKEGEVNMTDVFADRPLASIAVASGATVTGFAVCQTATLNSGAIVKQTVTGSGTSESSYTCPTLMVNGDVNVAGVKFAVDGVDLSQVTSGENANLTLLSAKGTVNGTPLAEGSIVSSIQKMIWKPTVSDNKKSVVMSLVKAASGFALFIY